MASQIAAIYDALAGKSLTVGTTVVEAKDADEIPNSLSASDLPIRLLTPLITFGGTTMTTGDVWAKATVSAFTETTWTVNDVMYWRPIAAGVGVKAHAKNLVAYATQYMDMLKSDTALEALGVTKVDHTIAADVLNYPQGSTNWYYGVVCTLVIRETGL